MTHNNHKDISLLRDRLIKLRSLRKNRKLANQRPRQKRLSSANRVVILKKTGGKCHICGGNITERWQADHVLAHSAGGSHSVDNFLPAHNTCNNYRWDYLSEEFELILKFGVWARTQIEKGTPIGRDIDLKFSNYEARRMARRKSHFKEKT